MKSVFTPQKTMEEIFGRTRSLGQLQQGKEKHASRQALISIKQRETCHRTVLSCRQLQCSVLSTVFAQSSKHCKNLFSFTPSIATSYIVTAFTVCVRACLGVPSQQVSAGMILFFSFIFCNNHSDGTIIIKNYHKPSWTEKPCYNKRAEYLAVSTSKMVMEAG